MATVAAMVKKLTGNGAAERLLPVVQRRLQVETDLERAQAVALYRPMFLAALAEFALSEADARAAHGRWQAQAQAIPSTQRVTSSTAIRDAWGTWRRTVKRQRALASGTRFVALVGSLDQHQPILWTLNLSPQLAYVAILFDLAQEDAGRPDAVDAGSVAMLQQALAEADISIRRGWKELHPDDLVVRDVQADGRSVPGLFYQLCPEIPLGQVDELLVWAKGARGRKEL